MAVKELLLVLTILLCIPGVVSSDCPNSPFTASNGTIRSPGFNTSQSYGNNLTCAYYILVPEDRRLILEFKTLSVLGTMPNCLEDSLEILVGKSMTSLGKFCSCSDLSMPNKIYSLDNYMTLIFRTDGSKRAAGFEAQYTSVKNNTKLDPSSNCSSTKLLSSSHGTFFTPNWPLPYPRLATCSWTFHPQPSKIVHLFFSSFVLEEYLECEPDRPSLTNDEIRINGTNSTGGNQDIIPRLCAKPDIAYITIKEMQAVRVRFKSNLQKEFSGVIAGYASYKKGTLESSDPGCKSMVMEPTQSTPKPTTNPTTNPTVKATGTGKPTEVKGYIIAVSAVAGVVFICAIAIGAWWVLKKKKRNAENIPEEEGMVQTNK